MKTFVFVLALAAPISASAVPAPDSYGLQVREEVNTTLAELDDRQAPAWTFNCYSSSQACRGMGATSGGSSSTLGCSPIDANGCNQFSFDGGGNFLLCIYDETGCTGEVVTSVNGGKVTCLSTTNGASWLVANADESC